MKTATVFLFCSLLCFGCVSEQSVIYDDLKPCDLEIIPSWDQAEGDYERIGQVSYRDNGFSFNCGEKTVMRKVMTKACEARAEAVVMYDVIPPWTGGLSASTCYQASASFIRYKKN